MVKSADMTEYVVLSCYEQCWTEFTRIHSRSARQAVLDALETGEPKTRSTLYVAVPARSWNPLTVRTETKTVVTVESGGDEPRDYTS